MKTKSLIIIPVFILSLFATSTSTMVREVHAWDDCPKGLVNDEYPGECPRYVDTDGNGFCDHSEPAPEDRIDNLGLNVETVDTQAKNSSETIVEREDIEKEDKDTTKIVIAVVSILLPLIVILGYASINKTKQGKK